MAQLNDLLVLGNSSLLGEINLFNTLQLSKHIYLTGAVANSSTSNTSQIVFGTPTNNHVAISSNTDALVINKDTTTSSPQIVLYINKQSSFPNGISCGPLTVNGNTTVTGTISATSNISSGGTGTFSGNVIVGTESATNPYYKLTDSNKNAWYFQVLNNKCYIGPTSTKALNIDIDGNICAVGSVSIGRKADTTIGTVSTAIGYNVTASGSYSHAEGNGTIASKNYSHAEGYSTTASGLSSHAEGINTKASGSYSHAEGYDTTASGMYSHAEGYRTIASGARSHAEGADTTASGPQSHAEGYNTTASGSNSHAEGRHTTASGSNSHASGFYTTANADSMFAIGSYNNYEDSSYYVTTSTSTTNWTVSRAIYIFEGVRQSDNAYVADSARKDRIDGLRAGYYFYTSSNIFATIYQCTKYEEVSTSTARVTYKIYTIKDPRTEKGTNVFVVGNGTSASAHSNAHTLDWSGNAWFAGDVYVGSTSGTNKDNGSLKLATESFVSNGYLPLSGGTLTNDLTVNGNIRGTKVYGAVWNDYAEYRQTHHKVRPGQCVYEKGDGSLAISYERMMPGANIVSDTFGFAIGETDECKTPLAVSGRVLAYAYEPKETYKPGDAVCSGPNGTISKMTRAEIRDYPERIVGTVSEIPTYEIWGSGNVKVNGRIWIKVR